MSKEEICVEFFKHISDEKDIFYTTLGMLFYRASVRPVWQHFVSDL